VHPIVEHLLDPGSSLELHPKWAPNVTTTLGRLGGRTIGVIANNPLRLGGCWTVVRGEGGPVRADVRRLRVPMAVVVDVPG
jgi:acetyl-CoA/propionyl-CoA carboxylase carboxyl transferase subunit